MKIIINEKDDSKVAVIDGSDLVITDVQSAMDLMATVQSEYLCEKLLIDKVAVCEEFFDLKSGLAGEILQKYVNYGFRLAIVGDFSVYSSKSLRDFIFESNKGCQVFFLQSQQEALDRLHSF